MENPCDDCLVRVMCTEICSAKGNYSTVLRRAIQNYPAHIRMRSSYFSKMYQKYREMQVQNTVEITLISQRRSKSQFSV